MRGARAQAWALGERACCRREGRGVRRRASCRRARCARQAGARGAAAGAGASGAWLGAGRAGWLRAVHSAHFRSVLTRYFPESNFLDIVREPGS